MHTVAGHRPEAGQGLASVQVGPDGGQINEQGEGRMRANAGANSDSDADGVRVLVASDHLNVEWKNREEGPVVLALCINVCIQPEQRFLLQFQFESVCYLELCKPIGQM